MNKIIFFYDEGFKNLDFGSGHPMRGDRYQKALAEFKNMEILDRFDLRKPDLISDDILTMFHTEEYINLVKKISEQDKGMLGPDTPGFKGVYDVAVLSVSASVRAADVLLENEADVSVNICGGWHHAFENKGRGFCIFNDIAITANYLLTKGVNKIMVIDYDAHHGDGTQRAFYNNYKVYTISFHQDPSTFYPFRSGYENEAGVDEGKGFNRNFPLSSSCDDTEFISKFNQTSGLIKDFLPEIVILQMGVDGSKECTISNMQLTKGAYDYVSKVLMDIQKKYKFKMLALGGGGFIHPMLGQHWGIQIKNFIEK